jgi:hypothetical protein
MMSKLSERMAQNCIIGIDFDNTIVSYDNLMYELAIERGLIEATVPKSKKQIRDRIRQQPNGEIEWQKLQGAVYGPQMQKAQLIEGVAAFFQACRQQGIPTYIVSHKTEYANYDETRTSLREAALNWMTLHHFFQPEGLGLLRESVYFESTRVDKIQRIRTLNCTHFIDDLEETFLESTFPESIAKILYAPHAQHSAQLTAKVAKSWQEIFDRFFIKGDG